MDKNCLINVIIPTYNNAGELDATLGSLLAQEYDLKQIFIVFVDFGSTDGTQEKILTYQHHHRVGFYTLAGKRIGRTMAADAAKLGQVLALAANTILLWPGDVIYPHCLQTVAKWMNRALYLGYSPQDLLLVGEVDIEKDGAILKQAPLFDKPCHFKAFSRDSLEFAAKGYRHAVMTYGIGYTAERDKLSTHFNQRTWWNQLIPFGVYSNTLYTNEVLGRIRWRTFPDELDEILFRFEEGLSYSRLADVTPEMNVDKEQFDPAWRQQLAKYALWRAFLLYEWGKTEESENCFLIAQIIRPDIVSTTCWLKMEALVERNDEASLIWLREYFTQEEPVNASKRPVGGIFSRSMRRALHALKREGD